MNSYDPWRAILDVPPTVQRLTPAPYYEYGFIGAEPPSARRGLAAEVAPVLAPATGITARAELDQHQHLHAEICVDGRCYKACIDLAPAIAAVMAKIASYHTDLHRTMPAHVGAEPLAFSRLDEFRRYAAQLAAKERARVVGVSHDGYLWQAVGFPSRDLADGWFATTSIQRNAQFGPYQQKPANHYVAWFDKNDVAWPSPIREADEATLAHMTETAKPWLPVPTRYSASIQGEMGAEYVLGAIDQAVGAAGDALIDTLVDRHVTIACAGWLGDIGHAIKSAARGATHGVASTLRRLKGPIAVAASVAAVSAAAAIPGVGPAAAPLAGKLAGDLVRSAAGDKSATKRVDAASKKAQTDETTAVALDVAKKAAAQSTATHHVTDTAKKAAAGHPEAQQDIAKLATDAEQGDPASKAAADLVANVMKSEWGAKLWEKATGRGPETVSGWVDMYGGYGR